jgi:hypothetical protein
VGGAAGYGLWQLGDADRLWHLVGGLVIFFALAAAALWLFHRQILAGVVAQARGLAGRAGTPSGGPRTPPSPAAPDTPESPDVHNKAGGLHG